MSTLTLDGYHRMTGEDRERFNAWLQANGLSDWKKTGAIVEGSFADGALNAKCVDMDALDAMQARGEPVDEVPTVARTFTLTTPPPEFVLDYCT